MNQRGSGEPKWGDNTYDGPTLDRPVLPPSDKPTPAAADPDATMTRAQLRHELAGRRALPPADVTSQTPSRPKRAADDVTREATAPLGDSTQPRAVRDQGVSGAADQKIPDADQTLKRDSVLPVPQPQRPGPQTDAEPRPVIDEGRPGVDADADDTLPGVQTAPSWFAPTSDALTAKPTTPASTSWQPPVTAEAANQPQRPASPPAPQPVLRPQPASSAEERADWATRWKQATGGDRPQPMRSAGEVKKTDAKKDSDADAPAPKKKSLGFLAELGIVVVGAMLLTILLRTFVFQLFEVPSGSMENTLQVHDKIVAQKVIPFQRGEVIVFKDANKWLDSGEKPTPNPLQRGLEWLGLMPDTSENYLTKRVIGMPGDRVSCCDQQGRMSVNGKPLDETGYLYSDATGMAKPAEKPFEVIVPEGHVWVMGDHRNASGDSRCHLGDVSLQGGPAGAGAFVPIDAIVGSVPLILSPTSRFQRLATPDAYQGIPEPALPPPTEGKILRGDGC